MRKISLTTSTYLLSQDQLFLLLHLRFNRHPMSSNTCQSLLKLLTEHSLTRMVVKLLTCLWFREQSIQNSVGLAMSDTLCPLRVVDSAQVMSSSSQTSHPILLTETKTDSHSTHYSMNSKELLKSSFVLQATSLWRTIRSKKSPTSSI